MKKKTMPSEVLVNVCFSTSDHVTLMFSVVRKPEEVFLCNRCSGPCISADGYTGKGAIASLNRSQCPLLSTIRGDATHRGWCDVPEKEAKI